MLKSKKSVIEVILCNIGLLFFMFFPERTSLFSLVCWGGAMVIIDVIMLLFIFKYKCDIVDLKDHKILRIIYYLAILFFAVGVIYSFIELWIS